jgi:hypothetical protein
LAVCWRSADHCQAFSNIIDLARRLWDSWEDDAVVRGVGTGRYLADQVNRVNFTGARFSVTRPLITSRPQRWRVVMLARTHLASPHSWTSR